MSFLRDILTADRDSRVYDLVRVGTAAALVVGMGLTVYAVVWRGEARRGGRATPAGGGSCPG